MPPGSRWANEGVTRVLGFLIEGAAESGRIRFEIVAPFGMQEAIEADLRSLKATENEDWIVHKTPNPHNHAEVAVQTAKATALRSSVCFARFIIRLPSPLLALVLVCAAVLAFPFVALRGVLRRQVSWQNWKGRLYFIKASILRPREILNFGALFLRNLGPRWASLLGRALSAEIDTSCPPINLEVAASTRNFDEQIREMATFANEKVDVEGWIVLFPFYRGAASLKKSKAVIFPDALVYDFPMGWNPDQFWQRHNGWPQWREKSSELLKSATTVITFSKHVADRHCLKLFDLVPEQMRCIPLAPPDLMPYLPMLKTTGRRGTCDTRRQAGDLLRAFAGQNGLSYLCDFPFESTPYFVVATQDRPTKNIGMAAQALFKLIREDHVDIKMITTARFFFGETWTSLPGLIENEQLQYDILSMPDLPREIHAALFHCATLTVHPSFFEGIVGTLPFYETLSVGTPCLFARGPHTEELVDNEPELSRYMFDPYDVAALRLMIRDVMNNRESVLDHQMPIGDRLRHYSWSDAASCYAAAATGQSEASWLAQTRAAVSIHQA